MEDENIESCCGCCKKFFLFLCLLTGQYFPKVEKQECIKKARCHSSFWLLYSVWSFIILFVNFCPTATFSYLMLMCQPDYNSMTMNESFVLAIRYETSNESSFDLVCNKTVGGLKDVAKFNDYSKVIFLLSSIASTVSYLFFWVPLVKLYLWPHFKHFCKGSDYEKELSCWTHLKTKWYEFIDEDVLPPVSQPPEPLHPFDDSDYDKPRINELDKCTSTQFKAKDIILFVLLLVVSVLINLYMFFVFCNHHFNEKDWKRTRMCAKSEILEKVCYFTYIFSVFCTLSSCFIFSKLAYGIQRNCINIVNFLNDVNIGSLEGIRSYLKTKCDIEVNGQSREPLKLYYLQERCNRFVKVSKVTLRPFHVWFFLHWILYIITFFFCVDVFIEALLFHINVKLPFIFVNRGIKIPDLEISFLFCYCVSNCFFFLYACLRAASITESRKVLIHKINRKYIRLEHIAPQLKEQFVRYLESQDFGFKLQIFCAKVPFTMNIAYISLLLSLFGILFNVVISIDNSYFI